MNKYMTANVAFSKFARNYLELKKYLPIRPSEIGVIDIIGNREGDFTPLMLADIMGVSKPMIAAHIQALMKKGYICKEVSDVDKRSFFVRPTEKGKALAVEFKERQTEYLKMIEAKLGKEEFDELVRLINETQNILEKIKEV